jgi:16S rRNA processing protein RimM
MEDWLKVGTIVSPQGLKGELKVTANSDFPERFEKPGQRWLQSPDGTQIKEVELIKGRSIPGKNLYVVQLAGIEDRSQAEELRGYKLLVRRSDRPQLAQDEYHVSDLIDLEVYNQLSGEKIGIVSDIFWGGNDLLEVKLDKQLLNESESLASQQNDSDEKQKSATVLIPFVKEIVPIVDIERRRIEIAPPPGLLEVNNA